MFSPGKWVTAKDSILQKMSGFLRFLGSSPQKGLTFPALRFSLLVSVPILIHPVGSKRYSSVRRTGRVRPRSILVGHRLSADLEVGELTVGEFDGWVTPKAESSTLHVSECFSLVITERIQFRPH